MQIEAGKYYKTRDGRKAGPMKPNDGSLYRTEFAFYTDESPDGRGAAWRADGSYDPHTASEKDDCDIVAPWEDSPVREVTRREIVPGTYGIVEVGPKGHGEICIHIKKTFARPEELDSTAMVLSQLAEALRDV